MYDGILNVYKEAGYTSFDVVAKLRGILHQKKIGHTGTLDPMAEGVLVVCLGKATKLCDILPDHDKIYEAEMVLGTVTDTEDTTGQVLSKAVLSEADYSEERIQEAVRHFCGTYDQIPPMYSAIKVNGKKLYELARQGEVIERKPRSVTIHELSVLRIEFPKVILRVSCSRGTYIRSLCRDIGEYLGCGACMGKLVRTSACGCDRKDGLTLDAIETLEREGRLASMIVPIDAMYPDSPRVYVQPEADRLLYNGNKLRRDNLSKVTEGTLPDREQQRLLVYDSKEKFIGIYEYRLSEQMLVPYKMFL